MRPDKKLGAPFYRPGEANGSRLAWVKYADQLEAENALLARLIDKDTAVIAAIGRENAKLKAAMRESYEVYAGMDGFKPETCPEGYCLRIIDEMAKPLREGLKE
jgi:hypothetical protein